ncbi:MAG: glycosyltransferase family 39 protein [Planctomycetota bacterium]
MNDAAGELSIQDPRTRTRVALITILAVVVGGLLRAADLDKQPFWLDEQASFDFAKMPFWKCVFAEAQHPPLYRTLLWGSLRTIGETDALVRILSLIFGTATIAIGCLLTARLRVSALPQVAFLLTISPFLYYYSRENRNYALLILLSLWSTLALLRIMREGRGLIGYAVLTVLLAYTHYFGVFVLLAHEWVFWRHRRSGATASAKSWLTMRTLSALAVSPWVYWLSQNLEMQERGWLLNPFMGTVTTFTRMIVGYGMTSWPTKVAEDMFSIWLLRDLVVLSIVLAPAAWMSVRGFRRLSSDPLAVGVVRSIFWMPFLILVPYSIQTRFISERYLAFLAPFVLMVYGIGWSLQEKRRRLVDFAVIGTMSFALMCHLIAPRDIPWFSCSFQKEQWPAAAEYAREFEPEKILYCHDYVRPVFNRYYGWQDGFETEFPVERLCLVLSHHSDEEEAEARQRFADDYEIVRETWFPADAGIRVILLQHR